MVLPMVRFLEPEETVDLDRAIRSLEEFDWLIFTSANAVAFFQRRCRALGMGPSGKAPEIAAVGSATRLALQKEGLQASLVPAEFSGAGPAAGPAGAVAAKNGLLARSARAGGELASLRVACEAVGPVTAEAIRSAGFTVAIEADEATAVSLVSALERHFAALEIKPAREQRPRNRREA